MRWPGFYKTLFRLSFGRRLPKTRGQLTVDGLQGRVNIRRDAFGIPYIDAEGDVDAWFAVGFCQAQDRTFQLESLLRATRGTLSALLGSKLVPSDRLSRRVGFHRAALAQLPVLDTDISAMLHGFAAGITAGATVGRPRRAHEFALLRADPSPWTAVDVLGLMKLQAFLLAANWDTELARHQLLEDGEETVQALDFRYPEWLNVGSPSGSSAGTGTAGLAEEIACMREVVHVGGGSNAWAVAPWRTTTGNAILANDPHLAAQLPPHWYLSHVTTPDWTAAGASFVGAPGFPAGQNAAGAWGVTVNCTDNTDLCLEKISPDGQSVLGPDGEAEPCQTVDEVIEIKGGQRLTERVLVTPRGPIVTPPLEGDLKPMSLRATWLEGRKIRGLLDLHRSTDFATFRQACAHWPSSGLTLVYAGSDGTVGWQVVGDIPRRLKGSGWLPHPAQSGPVWHEDHVPFDDNPHGRDPECGFVAAANNRPIPASALPFLTVDFVDGYRHARIRELLEARQDWCFETVAGLQMDQESLPWRDLRDAVLKVSVEGDARLAQDLLSAWEGRVAIGSSAATVFELFVDKLGRRIVDRCAPTMEKYGLGKGFSPLVPKTLFSSQRTILVVNCLKGRVSLGAEWDWDSQIAEVLGDVVNDLRGRFGHDPKRWAWGHVRPLTLEHPMAAKWPLKHIYNLGPLPYGGDAHTVSQGSVDSCDPFASPGLIASLRMVVNPADPAQNSYVLPGGQSGNPLSPNYSDQFDLWKKGGAISIGWNPEDIDQRVTESLVLEPIDSTGTYGAGC